MSHKGIRLRSAWKTHIPARLWAALAPRPLLTSHIKRGQRRKWAATSRMRPRSGEGRREEEGKGAGREGARSDGNRGDKKAPGGRRWRNHGAFRCKGSRTRADGSQRFTGQLNLSCFVAISMQVQGDPWLSQPLLLFSLSSTLLNSATLFFPSSSPSCNSALTFLPLTLKLFIAFFSSPTPALAHYATLFSAPPSSACFLGRAAALLAISSGLSLA